LVAAFSELVPCFLFNPTALELFSTNSVCIQVLHPVFLVVDDATAAAADVIVAVGLALDVFLIS